MSGSFIAGFETLILTINIYTCVHLIYLLLLIIIDTRDYHFYRANYNNFSLGLENFLCPFHGILNRSSH